MTLIPASAPDHFTEDTPTAILVRQVLGAIAQFDKAILVAKLKAARDRKRGVTGKCGGRRSTSEARPEMVALARLRRKRPKGGQRSLREIAAVLEAAGYVNERGAQFAQCRCATCWRSGAENAQAGARRPGASHPVRLKPVVCGLRGRPGRPRVATMGGAGPWVATRRRTPHHRRPACPARPSWRGGGGGRWLPNQARRWLSGGAVEGCRRWTQCLKWYLYNLLLAAAPKRRSGTSETLVRDDPDTDKVWSAIRAHQSITADQLEIDAPTRFIVFILS